MRIINVVFAGALAAAAMLTAPAQARNSDAQNGEDKASSSSCSAILGAASLQGNR